MSVNCLYAPSPTLLEFARVFLWSKGTYSLLEDSTFLLEDDEAIFWLEELRDALDPSLLLRMTEEEEETFTDDEDALTDDEETALLQLDTSTSSVSLSLFADVPLSPPQATRAMVRANAKIHKRSFDFEPTVLRSGWHAANCIFLIRHSFIPNAISSVLKIKYKKEYRRWPNINLQIPFQLNRLGQ